jgi:hypothetical protein
MRSSEATSKSDGIQGWLVVILCYLTAQSVGYAAKLSIPLYLWLTVPRLAFLPDLPTPDFELTERIANVVMLIAIVISIACLLARRTTFPKICMAILFGTFILPPAMSLYHQISLGVASDAGTLSRAFMTIPTIVNLAAFVATAWYLGTSRRVARTFVR